MIEKNINTGAGTRLPGIVESNAASRSAAAGGFSSDLDVNQLLHELQVMQQRLEIQERDLHNAHEELRNTKSTMILTDISERRQAELYRDLGREVLKLLNEQGNLQDSIQHIVSVLKTRMEFDAVGIRLQDADDFPYLAQDGFSKGFLLTENSLIGRAANGDIFRDKDGTVKLECICGLVLSDIADKENPHFTSRGSFWTNDSHPLLNIPPENDPRFHPRNECILQGYASVALVPVRNNGRTVGLIQFNDHRKGRFTLEAIELLEDIASHLGSALMRKQAEDEHIVLKSQFYQAQKMESVGRLVGGIAHDFNNILTVILGHAYLALQNSDPNQQSSASLKEIHKAAERSAALTNQLLAFARKQTIAPIVLDLNHALSGMINMLQRLIGDDIHLTWQQSADLWPVKIDPSQIDQILANLCVNARDAISGVGKITIEAGNSFNDDDFCTHHAAFMVGEYVRLTVRDDGCGMDKPTLAKIFEPFFTTKGIGEGTGLGLATVYGIVKQNNGFINVNSEPGLGTTFEIYLPRYEGKDAQPKAIEHAEPAPHGREAILVVEDEPTILDMITMLLTTLGYSVYPANSPAEAIHIAREYSGKIDLLLSDVIMPGMNGKDLCNNLLTFNPKLKRLFMSGYTVDAIAHLGVLDDEVNFLLKPFPLPALASKVREVLDCSR